jgi:hypothetical protein
VAWVYGVPNSDRYSIGFDRTALEKLRPPRGIFSRVQLLRLEYNEEDQRAAIRDTLAEFLPSPPQKRDLTLELTELAARFKDPAFDREDEWRLHLSTLGNGCKVAEFSVTTDHIKPYIPLLPETGDRLPIEEVLVLPAGSRDRAVKAAKLAIERYGYGRDIVCESKIPFLG